MRCSLFNSASICSNKMIPPAQRTLFQKAIGFDPVYDQGYYFLARLLQRSRRLEEAATVCFDGLIATASPLLRRGLLELDYSCAEIDASLARGALPHARSIPDDPDFPPLPMAGLRERVEAYPWWHSINLGDGIVTPGHKSRYEILREAEAIFAPISVRGRSVADIGAWNGGLYDRGKTARRRHAYWRSTITRGLTPLSRQGDVRARSCRASASRPKRKSSTFRKPTPGRHRPVAGRIVSRRLLSSVQSDQQL